MSLISYVGQPFVGLIESRNYLKAVLAANPPTHILVKQAAMQVLFAAGVCAGAIAMNCVVMAAIYYNVSREIIFLGNLLINWKEPTIATAGLSLASGILAVSSLVSSVALRTLFPVTGIVVGALIHIVAGAMHCVNFQNEFTNTYLPLASNLNYASFLNNVAVWVP